MIAGSQATMSLVGSSSLSKRMNARTCKIGKLQIRMSLLAQDCGQDRTLESESIDPQVLDFRLPDPRSVPNWACILRCQT